MPSDNNHDKSSLIYLAVGILVLVSACLDTIRSLLHHWLAFDGNQSHGLLVVALSAYMIITTLRANRPLNPQPSVFAVAGLALCSLLWYVAAIANIDIIQKILLLPLLTGLFAAILGLRYTRLLLPAIGLLIFAIPVWDFLVPGLVNLASHAVGWMVHMSGIPALIESNSFYLPDGKVDIVGGCSGIKYLTIAIVISYYILITSRSSLYWKIALVVIATALSILMNWIRIFVLILIAYFSEMQSSLVDDHETFGWLLFALVMIPLILLGKRLPLKKNEPIQVMGSTPPSHLTRISIGAIVAILVGPVMLQQIDYRPPDTASIDPLSHLQLQDAELLGPDKSHLLTINHARQSNRHTLRYQRDLIAVEIFDNWQTDTGDKLVPYISSLFDHKLWSKQSEEDLTMADGEEARGLLLQRKPYGELLYVIYWFEVGPYTTSSYSIAKMLQVPAILLGNNFFRAYGVRMQCQTPDCDRARRQTLELANQFR